MSNEPLSPWLAGEFWSDDETMAAVKQRDFGRLLRRYRTYLDPPISQLKISGLLGLTQGQVSRIESGKTIVKDLDKLARWSVALGFPDDHLWFDFPLVESSDEFPRPIATAVVSVDESPSSVHGGESRKRPRSSVHHASTPSGRTIGGDDIAILVETTRSFRQLDNRFGGGHVRSAVAAYLSDEVEPALRVGRFARGARRDFQRAAAELNQLVGWMAYDVGDNSGGRRYLRRALDISSEAQDNALSAEMLAAMSHQAAYAGRADEAIDFAISARQSATRSGAPALQAESAALEAQGYAIQRDPQRCIAALRRAESAFDRVSPDNTPKWLGYFDRAYMSAKFAHALRELGKPVEAERFARESLQMCDGYDRGRLFNTALLAGILIDRGRVDEAASCAHIAVRMVSQVHSIRAWRYLDDVRVQLYPFRKSNELASLWPELIALRSPFTSNR